MTRTRSPYFSPKSAIAPISRASSIGTSLNSCRGRSARIRAETRRSTCRSCSGSTLAKWAKSKRRTSSETKGEIDECVRQHGLSPVRYLEKLGILSEHLVLAHVVWIDDEEMDLLAKYNVSVVHNPASNLKLASGYAFKYEEMKRRGIRIGIGTDGCSSSNNLDMVVAMKLASFLGKGWRFDSTACKADDIFASATSVGADILGIPAGRVEEGALADVCLVDLNTPELVPLNSLTSNLVYATSGSSCVDTVIVAGRILMRDKYVPGQEAIIAEAREVARRLFKHA